MRNKFSFSFLFFVIKVFNTVKKKKEKIAVANTVMYCIFYSNIL